MARGLHYGPPVCGSCSVECGRAARTWWVHMGWKARVRREICALVLGSVAGLTAMHLLPTVYAASVLPQVSLTLPTNGATVSGVVLLQAMADNAGVAGLQFRVNGVNVGS